MTTCTNAQPVPQKAFAGFSKSGRCIEALDHLLHFVQNGFATDRENSVRA